MLPAVSHFSLVRWSGRGSAVKRVLISMQQTRCELCGRLVVVEANQPGTCPSCGHALHIPPNIPAPAAAAPAPVIAQGEGTSAANAATESAPALTLGPFVADPAPLVPPPPLPTPPAPEVAAGMPVAAAPVFEFASTATVLPVGAANEAGQSGPQDHPYPEMVALPPMGMAAPPTIPLMPPSDAPALEPLPLPFALAEPDTAEQVIGVAGPLIPPAAAEETVTLAGPLMPAAEQEAVFVPPSTSQPEPEPVTQIAEPAEAYMPVSAPEPEMPTELLAPFSSPEPEPVTQTAEPAAPFIPPTAEPAANVPLAQEYQPAPTANVEALPAAPAPPATAPMPPAGYPQYPQYPQYAQYPQQPGMAPSQPLLPPQGPAAAPGYPPGYPGYPGYPPGYPIDPRMMPPMAPPSVPLGVPYPSAYPGLPMVPPQPPRRKVSPLLIAVIVLVILAIVGAGVALALARGPDTGAAGQLAATPTIAATATPSVPAGFTLFKDQGGIYSLAVPSDWAQTKSSSGGASINLFSSTQEEAAFEIATIPESGLDPTATINGFFSGASDGGSVTNKQGPTTVQQAGETWTQESGDTTIGGSSEHVVVLFAGHGSGSVLIAFLAPKADFDSINTQDFQPMFTSFQFLT